MHNHNLHRIVINVGSLFAYTHPHSLFASIVLLCYHSKYLSSPYPLLAFAFSSLDFLNLSSKYLSLFHPFNHCSSSLLLLIMRYLNSHTCPFTLFFSSIHIFLPPADFFHEFASQWFIFPWYNFTRAVPECPFFPALFASPHLFLVSLVFLPLLFPQALVRLLRGVYSLIVYCSLVQPHACPSKTHLLSIPFFTSLFFSLLHRLSLSLAGAFEGSLSYCFSITEGAPARNCFACNGPPAESPFLSYYCRLYYIWLRCMAGLGLCWAGLSWAEAAEGIIVSCLGSDDPR